MCVCVSDALPVVSMLLWLPWLPLLLGDAPAVGAAERLSDCLQDADYDQLVQTVQTGLPAGDASLRVAVVGAGVAGLTAAKLLQDAGHQVRPSVEARRAELAGGPPFTVLSPWQRGDRLRGQRARGRTCGDLQEPAGSLVRRPGRHEDPPFPPVS